MGTRLQNLLIHGSECSFNQSAVDLLGLIEAMGRSARTVTYEFERPIVVPPVRPRELRFVGVSDTV
jgi:hypothetical protein